MPAPPWYSRWDELHYYAQVLGMAIILPTVIIGAIILLRKDRSLPALMLSIGGVLALACETFGHIVYIWITDGSLFISQGEPRWQLHLAVEASLGLLKMGSGITAAIGCVLFVNRFKPTQNQEA